MGLTYIATMLEQARKVKMVNGLIPRLSWNGLLYEVKNWAPHAVGITAPVYDP
ncbi:MAG: hypothetical protein QXT26_08885 [Thermoproteota archaeon]